MKPLIDRFNDRFIEFLGRWGLVLALLGLLLAVIISIIRFLHG